MSVNCFDILLHYFYDLAVRQQYFSRSLPKYPGLNLRSDPRVCSIMKSPRSEEALI